MDTMLRDLPEKEQKALIREYLMSGLNVSEKDREILEDAFNKNDSQEEIKELKKFNEVAGWIISVIIILVLMGIIKF